jgi:hypothetical protein
LKALIVPSGFVTACLLAGSPTRSCPSFVNATYDGKALPPKDVPSAEGIKVVFPPSITAAAEFEVPKSIPIILAILNLPYLLDFYFNNVFKTLLVIADLIYNLF